METWRGKASKPQEKAKANEFVRARDGTATRGGGDNASGRKDWGRGKISKKPITKRPLPADLNNT